MRKLVRTVLWATIGVFACPALAQYPTRPIQIIVPLPPGTAIDMMTRSLAAGLSQRIGQSVVVQNKAGADGAIGAAEVLRAAPDGYTLLMGTNSPLSAAPLIAKTPPYDPIADFTPIAHIGKFTHVILVNPEVPVKSLREFFDYARARPGKVDFGSGNTFSLVSTAQLMKLGGITMTHVPYKGEPQALVDLVAGRVQFMWSTKAVTKTFIQEGKVRALAVTDEARDPDLPDVPTLSEAGISGFNSLTYAALVGPAKMPREAVDRLNREVLAVIRTPQVREQMARLSFEPIGSTPEALTELLRKQLQLWSVAIDELKLREQ